MKQKNINKKNKNMKKLDYLAVLGILTVLALMSLLQWMLIDSSGLGFFVSIIVVLLVIEIVISLDNRKSVSWMGLGFHLWGFLNTLVIFSHEWGKPFTYVVDDSHRFWDETSPAYWWWVLAALIVLRVALHPFLLRFSKR